MRARPSLPVRLSTLFGRRSAPAGRVRTRRQRRSTVSVGEQLEPRKMLAFDYLGITHTAVPTIPTNQAYQYNFEIYNSGPTDEATMYMRHVADINSLQFDSNTSFNTLANLGANVSFSVPGFGNGTFLPPVNSPTVYSTGPLSLAATNTTNRNWNTGTTTTEPFYLSKVYVRARPGTVNPTFILHVGDEMPLALTVDFSAAQGGTGTIIIRSSAEETYSTASPANSLPPTGAGYDFFASEVYVQAALTPRFANDYRATDLIRIENAITGGLDARVSAGDFVIAAGASVSGSTNVQTGGGIPPTAGNALARYGYGGNGGDIVVEGSITGAGTVVLQTFSVDPRTIRTGPSGFISGSNSITLNNAGADGGIINVETRNFAQHNIFAGSVSSSAADIGISVRQTTGNLTINALPASRGRIDLQATAPGANVAINSNFDTIGALALTASTLNVTRPLSTQQGDITLTGGSVTLGSNVTAGRDGVGDIEIVATTGNVNVTSAAVVQAPGDTITISAPAGSITSDATLAAERLALTAGKAVTSRSRVTRVTAKAGGAVSLSDDDGLIVDSLETTTAGAVTVSAKGLLEVVDVATGGTGDVLLTTTAGGLVARDIRTQNGSLTLRADSGDIEAVGEVFVNGAGRDFSLEATQGTIVMSPSATFTVADQLSFSAPLGRVLTPGSITGVVVTDPGSGYATPPAVTLGSGSGAVVTPTVGSGRVTFVRLLNGGSGYVSAPAVVFDNAGTGGTGAIATAVMSGGSVVGINVTNGGVNYTSAPRISFVGGGGSGAEAMATINGLTSLVPTAGGSGYQVPPEVVISSGDGAATAAVDVDALGAILAVNVSQGGTSYDAAPTVVITDTSGSGFGATATANLTPGVTAGVVTAGGSGYPATTTATVAGSGTGATGRVLLGLTNDSITTPVSTGFNYRIGDLLTVVSGTGARIGVTGVTAGAVDTVTVLGGGRDYSVGDVLYLDDAALGGSGLQVTVTAVTTGGVITAASATAGGTGYTTAMRFLHAGGTGAILRVTEVNGSPTTTAAGTITAVVVDRPGTGYTTRPSAVAGGSGNGAVITFVDTSYTVVGYLPLTPGQGFTTGTPTITVVGAGGSAAEVVPVVSGVLASISVNNPGTGYDPTTTRVQLLPVAAGGGGSSQAVSVNGAGGITGINVATPGGGYVAPPRVSIVDLGGTGSGAEAIATTSAGVTGVVVTTAGSGYAVAPTVTIRDAGGEDRGTRAVATVANGFVTGITITQPGSGYTGTPVVTFSSGTAAATATTSQVVTGITITSSGAAYDPATTVVTLEPIGSGATAIANLTGGVVTSISITDNGSGYGLGGAPAPTVTLVPYGSGALATSTLSGGGVGGVTVTAPGATYAVPPAVTFAAPGGGGTTATGVAVVGNVAQLSATRLSWTALEQPLDALLDQFAIAKIVLTGAGDLDVTRASGDLVLEGAQTKDGSIRVAAQSLTVTGPVTAGDFNTSRTETVTLQALGGDLAIQSPVTAPLSVTLEAESGGITGTPAGVVTTKDLVIAAQSGVTLRTAVETVRGGVSGDGGPLTLTETDNLTVGTGTTAGTTLFANNGPISVTSLGGTLSVNRVDAGPTGSVSLSAAVNVVAAAASPTVAEVVGGSATLGSTSGRIDLDTDVGTIAASAPLATIDLDAVGVGPVTVTSATARNNVRIEAASALRVEAASSTLNNVLLTTTGAGSHLVVGPISAPIGVVSLDSAGDISQGDLTGPVSATAARVRALAGSVTLATAVGTFGGTADGDITVTDVDGITLGEVAPGVPADFARVQSNTGTVSVTAGGPVSALVVNAPQGDVTLTSSTAGIAVGAITAGTVSGVVTLDAAQSITDNDPAVDITAFRAVLSSANGSIGAAGDALDLAVAELSATAPLGTVDVTDADGVVLAGLTTTAARVTAAGAVTQTAPVTADSLAVTATAAGAVVLTDPANDVGTITGGTFAGDFVYVDANATTVGAAGITAGSESPVAGNGNIVLTAASGSLGIAGSLTAANDRIVLAAPAGTITQTAGTITAEVLEWTAFTAPTFIVPAGLNVSVFGLNLTGPGDLAIGTAGQPLTVASASTADGSITIVGSDVTIDGLVQAGGAGQAVAVDAGGSILFQNAGRIVNADAAGTVTLGAGTTVTATNLATETTVTAGGLLTVTAGGATGLKTDVGSLLATTAAGGLTIDDVGALAVAGINAPGQPVSLSAAGGITQTGAIVAAALTATTQAGGVILDAPGNDVDTVTGSTGAGSFVLTDADGFTVVAPGITAGSAGAGNGDIVLTALTGNLVVDANLTALDDTVRLRAPNGQLVQNPGSVITAGVLTWEAQSAILQPGNQIAAIGVNLTSPGPVRIPSTGTFPGTLRIAEVTTVDGAIEIAADDVVIAGLVQAGGAASSVVITAATGGVAFVESGRVVAQGPVTLGAATAITSTTLAPVVNVTTPAALLATAGNGGIDLDTAVGGVTATATGDVVLTEADAVTLSSVVSGGGSVTVVAGGTLTATSVSAASGGVNLTTTAGDVALGAVVANAASGTVTVSAAGGITDDDAGVDITAATAALTALAGGISADLAVGSVTATAPGTIDLSDVDAVTLTSVVSTAGDVSVTAGGAMTATSVSAASAVNLATTAGDVAVGSVTAGTATIAAAGSITGTGPGVDLTAATAALSAGTGTIGLDLAVAAVSASAPGSIVLTDVDGITLSGVASTGGDVTVTTAAGDIAVASVAANPATGVVSLTAAGGITDVDGDVDITAASAVLTALAGGIDADLAVGTVTATAPGSINLSDVDAVTLANVVSAGGSVSVTAGGTMTATNVSAVAGDVSLVTTAGDIAVGSVAAGTTSGRATISAAGGITDGDPGVDVTASAATLNAGTGGIDLDLAVGTVGGTAAGDVTLSNPGGITLAGLQSTAGNIAVAVAAGSIDVAGVTANPTTGTVTLDVPAGTVTQSGRLAAAVVNLNAPTAASVALTDPANAVSTLQTSIGGATLSMNNTVPLSIVADAGLSIGRVVNQGTLAVATPGDVLVGPATAPFPVLQSTTELDLRQVQGTVTLVNGGQLVAPSILLNPANPVIDVGGSVTTTDGLNQAVDAINSLPVIAGAIYEITVGANLTLTRPLVFDRPVSLSGPGFTLAGSGTAANGVVVNAGGSGSRITNLAFAGFSGSAVTLNAARNVTVSGITVSDSVNGLFLTGNLDGSTIRGNTFANNQFAMRLQAAQRATIGGREADQRNRIEGASRAGVLARGFCTRTTITGTVFAATPRTRTRFNIRSSRNLRVSGTIVERAPRPVRAPRAAR